MFSIFYGLFALFGKIGWNVEYGIDKAQSKKKAIEEGRDTYFDKKGKMHLISNDQGVVLCRNMSGETYYTDYNGKVVQWINKDDRYNYSKTTATWCLDNRREHITLNNLPPKISKDIKAIGPLLKDINTNRYLVLREFELDKGEMVDGTTWDIYKINRKIRNIYIRRWSFYMDAITLELLRESDGKAELRRRGYKGCISERCRDEFINAYNRKLKEEYEVEDFCRGRIQDFDVSSKTIDKYMWEQNKAEKKTDE